MITAAAETLVPGRLERVWEREGGGEVFLDGIPRSTLLAPAWRRQVAYVAADCAVRYAVLRLGHRGVVRASRVVSPSEA